jgi:hypothetical protein
MRFRIVSLLLLLLFHMGSYLQAQNFEPHVINYTVDHGVPSSECYGLLQDSKGVIWIGTDKGICKYDGLRFSRLTTAEGLPENVVFDLVEDAKGRIWARTFSKGVFYIEKGRIVIPAFNASLLKALGNYIIDNFCVTPDDSVFMECDSSMLFTANLSSKEVTVIREPVKTIRFIQNTAFAYGGHLLDEKQPINVITGESRYRCREQIAFREILVRGAILKNKDIIFNNVDRLYLKRAGSDKLEMIDHFKSRIISIFQDREGGIWIGTVNDGVYYYSGNVNSPPRHYFNQESVSDFIEDREGNIWITTLKSGLFFIINKNVLSFGLNRPFNFIKKIGQEYIACSKGSEVYFLNTTGVQTKVNVLRKGNYPTYNLLYDVYEVDKHTLLFTGVGSFLMKKNNPNLQSPFNQKTYFKGIRQGPDTGFFYLFKYSGIFRFDSYHTLPLDTVIYPKSRITDLAIDAGRNFWLGTLAGLVYYHYDSRSFQSVNLRLLQTRINALWILNNKLFVATAGNGVLIYDIVTRKIIQVSQKEGLSSNSCQGIFVDGQNIWVATNKGVSVIHTGISYDDVLRVCKLDKHDGLPGEEINSVFVDEKLVWVASNSGITCFDKNIVAENNLVPQVNFEYARTNKQVYTNTGENHLFSHDENYLEFSFYGISYKSLRNLRYKYRLTGADDSWHYTYQPRITYPSLAAGTYTFELYAINNDGISSIAPIMFAFEIKPPFWQTWIFISGVILLLSGCIFLIFYRRIRIVRKREQEKNFYNNRMLEYELRALKAQMNPHFIFNAVASIQNFIMSNDAKSANKYLVKFSKLIRGVLDNSHSSLIPLEKELETLRLYTDIENLRLSNKISFRIVIESTVEPGRFMIPPLLIQPFVENAIWHGLLPKEIGCELSILLSIKDGKLICTIDDNGVGRKQAAFNKVKNGRKSSLGIEMTRNRIIAMEKIYDMNLDVDIIDKTDENLEPAGTTVIITLPIIT